MKKKKRIIKFIILVLISLLLILSGIISWNVYFSKQKLFVDQEKLFLNEVKHYYDLNKQYLPKKGETREMTLQNLYDINYIDGLYIPKTKTLCDSNSWVRVYHNDNDEYEYTTYLKCGKYESKVDHIGPKITLNGDMQLVIALGRTYEELGVASVEDNIDGKIDTSKVIIESNVDTSKLGSYEVTYTIRDKNYNKTVVTRTVIVANNLTEVVKKNTDATGYYKGLNQNNYLLYSGMLFRIVKVNEDGSIKLITDEAITNLRADYDNYENSNVDTWLKEVYLKSLNKTDKYLVDSTYCIGNINSTTDYTTECSSTITSKVGLLNISDYYNTLSNNESSVQTAGFMLANKTGINYVTAPIGQKSSVSTGILAPIRPVITLKANLYLLTGDGTSTNPYKLDDYSYAKANDLLNTRLTGEYFEYSGLKLRIIKIDSNNNVLAITSNPWTVQPNNTKLQLSVAELSNLKFNLTEENNPGYILNNDYLDYIDTQSIVDTEYEIPTNETNKKYTEYTKEKITAKILLPKSYEMFSSTDNTNENIASSYLYIDSSTNNNLIFMINGANGLLFELNKSDFYYYNIKAVMTIKGDQKIASGKGTLNNPYRLK